MYIFFFFCCSLFSPRRLMLNTRAIILSFIWLLYYLYSQSIREFFFFFIFFFFVYIITLVSLSWRRWRERVLFVWYMQQHARYMQIIQAPCLLFISHLSSYINFEYINCVRIFIYNVGKKTIVHLFYNLMFIYLYIFLFYFIFK